MPREKLNLHVEADTLTIEAESDLAVPEGLQSSHTEVGLARFRRVFTLSKELDTDKVSAELANGVLKLSIPKASTRSRGASTSRWLERARTCAMKKATACGGSRRFRRRARACPGPPRAEAFGFAKGRLRQSQTRAPGKGDRFTGSHSHKPPMTKIKKALHTELGHSMPDKITVRRAGPALANRRRQARRDLAARREGSRRAAP